MWSGLAQKADDLPRFLKERKPIIVTTQQKFAWVLEEIEKNPELKDLRVAFLIDEAHRSQEGQMGAAIRVPFRKTDEPDAEDAEDDARMTKRRSPRSSASTTEPALCRLHGDARAGDGDAVRRAVRHLLRGRGHRRGLHRGRGGEHHLVQDALQPALPDRPEAGRGEALPEGRGAKALQNVAFQDDGLIQYKAEVMLRIFEKDVKPLIGGRAKAMIVATSRVAGLRYFNIIKEKLKERGADYKVLYAFSDFVHPETNEAISEHAVNELKDGELIEDRFEGDDYRLMIVANKFQTGFDQPLLAGMFLDKPVVDRNAVQTVSRLNRCHEGKEGRRRRRLHEQRRSRSSRRSPSTARARRSSQTSRTRSYASDCTTRSLRRACSRRQTPPIS